jgi:hypothetical protein
MMMVMMMMMMNIASVFHFRSGTRSREASMGTVPFKQGRKGASHLQLPIVRDNNDEDSIDSRMI